MSNIANIKWDCATNGPGVRVAVYFSGCSLHCEGCFNSISWDYDYGEKFTEKTISAILDYCKNDYISGLSILGGEPLDSKNQSAVNKLLTAFREKFGDSKDVWLWTGFTTKKLPATEEVKSILEKTDVIVEGPFIKDRYKIGLCWRGSENQNIFKNLHNGKWRNITNQFN